MYHSLNDKNVILVAGIYHPSLVCIRRICNPPTTIIENNYEIRKVEIQNIMDIKNCIKGEQINAKLGMQNLSIRQITYSYKLESIFIGTFTE